MQTPIPQSYCVVPGRLLAGEYPHHKQEEGSEAKLKCFLDRGVTRFVDLSTSADRMAPYEHMLPEERITRTSFPIVDQQVPHSPLLMSSILDFIDAELAQGQVVYVHCWGGIGRTGTVVGCWLARHHGRKEALSRLKRLWKACSKAADRTSPETKPQHDYVAQWQEPDRIEPQSETPLWEWRGDTSTRRMADWFVSANNAVADAAKAGEWDRLFGLLEKAPEQINFSRLGGSARYTPLHQAARNAAPPGVVEELLRRGGLRLLRNARGERPADTARRAGALGLLDLLEPELRHPIAPEALDGLTQSVHAVMREVAGELIEEGALLLPHLEPLQEMAAPVLWFPVPGMYGGFRVALLRAGEAPQVEVTSWCRIAGGSGRHHLATRHGAVLLDSGFV